MFLVLLELEALDCVAPVSYTHLDVYKRQHVDCIVNKEAGYAQPYVFIVGLRKQK